MKKIVTVIGARPQFIKASVVSRALLPAGFNEVIVHTGQHFDSNMSDVFFTELGLKKPTHSLNVNGGSHGKMTGQMLGGIEDALLLEKPDAVLVYGDTNSTLAAALAAAKLHIPIAHVEAGLRSFNMRMPEEVNRVLTDRVSNWLFAPTAGAVQHLAREGMDQRSIHLVGDVMYDVALHYGRASKEKSTILRQLQFRPGSYVLATIHRAENTDSVDTLELIVDSLAEVSKSVPVIWPIHPRTRSLLKKRGRLDTLPNTITVLEPVGYLDMVQLEMNAAVIATDSGGVQKEAFFYKVPCVTVRGETEWTELVDAGWNSLVPPSDASVLTRAVVHAVGRLGSNVSPYGSGDASARIASVLAQVV